MDALAHGQLFKAAAINDRIALAAQAHEVDVIRRSDQVTGVPAS
jgi:hypothetical protein